jgi:glycosyltransferase involved in cell wall biosynthesis
MEPHKGVQVLFDAFVNSSDSHGFKLHIIGEGSLRQGLLNSVRKLGLAGRISLPGFLGRNETENVRRNAVAQIVPSIWYENAPAVALEAYSLGIPVVASEIGGLPEIVRPEDGSMTFPPGDSRELAKILVLLWETRDQLNDRRRMARNAYDSRFRPEIHLREYLKIIREQL